MSGSPQYLPGMASSYSYTRGTPPPLPVAPAHLTPSLPSMADLITDHPLPQDDDESPTYTLESPLSTSSSAATATAHARFDFGSQSARNIATRLPAADDRSHTKTSTSVSINSDSRQPHPPSFTDSVKRSTRFITAVPAADVLSKVETILNAVRLEKADTPIGLIGKVELNWDLYRLEVWGVDVHGPALVSLQLFQLPSTSNICSPDRSALFPTPADSPQVGSLSSSYRAFDALQGYVPQQLYLAEFVRAQLEIFAFKRFYQWVRQKLSELVKRDYAIHLFDQASSPK